MSPKGPDIQLMEEATLHVRDWSDNSRGDGDPPLKKVQTFGQRMSEKVQTLFARELTDADGKFRQREGD